MTSLVRFPLALVLGLSLLEPLAAATSAGQQLGKFTAGELALLPEWCIDSQAGPYGGPEGGEGLNKSPRARHWVGLMGKDFWAMHHYCYALDALNKVRNEVLRPRERDLLVLHAIGDLAYVVQNTKSTMPLLPEVYLRLGETYLLQGNLPAASNAFESSRTIKPDYWPAYDRWIGELMDLKQYAKARQLAEEGLRHAPNQPVLMKRLQEAKAREGAAPSRASASASAP
ncbi:MAG: hypothetical protein ABI782_11225 [Anaerolineaceae bacterium]